MQVKKRCRWLLSFTQQTLQPISGTAADPFDGAEVDANALGWALAVVTSRAFRTRGLDQVGVAEMVAAGRTDKPARQP